MIEGSVVTRWRKRMLRRPSPKGLFAAGLRPRGIAIFLVVFAALGAAAGMLVNHVNGSSWESTTAVQVRNWPVDVLLLTGQSNAVTTEDLVDVSILAESEDVLGRASAQLADGRSWVDLTKDTTAEPTASSHVISIKATATSASAAQRTSTVVAAVLTEVVQDQVEAAAAATAVPAGTPTDTDAIVKLRAELLNRTLPPLEVLGTTNPTQKSPTVAMPVALGVAGLAAGVLGIVALMFARPTVERPRDAQRLVTLPAVGFGLPDATEDAARFLHRLLEGRPEGALMICPVAADAEKSAHEFAEWARERTNSDASSRVRLVPEPTSAVLGTRPRDGEVAAVVLVCPRGTRRDVLADAVAMLAPWCPPSAVVVASGPHHTPYNHAEEHADPEPAPVEEPSVSVSLRRSTPRPRARPRPPVAESVA